MSLDFTSLAEALDPDVAAGLWWRGDGHCVGMATMMFYPERGQDANDAKIVCFGCPVRTHCLADALERKDREGCWGGLVEKERREPLREIAAALARFAPLVAELRRLERLARSKRATDADRHRYRAAAEAWDDVRREAIFAVAERSMPKPHYGWKPSSPASERLAQAWIMRQAKARAAAA